MDLIVGIILGLVFVVLIGAFNHYRTQAYVERMIKDLEEYKKIKGDDK